MKLGQKVAMSCGASLFTAYSTFLLPTFYGFISPLSVVTAQIKEGQAINLRSASDPTSRMHLLGQQIALEDIMNPMADDITTISAREREYIDQASAVSTMAVSGYLTLKAKHCYIMNKPELALEVINMLRIESIWGFPDSATGLIIRLLSSLMVIRNKIDASIDFVQSIECEQLWAQVKKDMEMVRIWSTTSPTSFLGAYRLVEAEFEFTSMLQENSSIDQQSNYVNGFVDEKTVTRIGGKSK